MDYTGAELMILEMIQKYLKESILYIDTDYRPKGGIFIKSKLMPLDSDLVELNLLGKLLFIGEEVIALININIYHDYEYRTDELAKIIMKILKNAVINDIRFDIERAWYDGKSKRKYQNILFKGVISKSNFQILLDSYF